jgi:putative FmdB family regulatory protein
VPTYQYVCTECGGQIEAVQKFTDDPLTMHEACGGKLRKVFSPVGIVFKGSGFYRTDSRNGKSSTSSSSAAGSSSDSSAASSSDGAGGGEKSSSSGGGGDGGGGDKAASAASGSSSAGAAKSSGSAGEKVA